MNPSMRRVIPRLILMTGLSGALGCAGSLPRAYVGGAIEPGTRVAILPLANYTERQDASDRVVPLLLVEVAGQRGLPIVDPGKVEELFSKEPWLLLDRLPPDLVDRFGAELGADLLLVGSILAFGYRDADVGRVPEFSVTLRLIRTPGGACLWSGSHARSGNDRESVFGLGRVDNLERLAAGAIRELVATLPGLDPAGPDPGARENAERR